MKVISYTDDQVEAMCRSIAKQISAQNKKYTGIYPILRGGYYPAVLLSRMLEIPLMYTPGPVEGALIMDDLMDSGRTLNPYMGRDIAVLIDKSSGEKRVTYAAEFKEPGEWIEFPWEDTATDLQDIVVRQLEAIGEDPNRPGLLDTPKRVVNMWKELFRGYVKEGLPKVTAFKNGLDGIHYDQMIVDNGDFHSQCEHHMVPFFGRYWFAYIPAKDGLVVGLSKIARLVDYHSAKLQIQERLVSDVVTSVAEALSHDGFDKPLGIAMVMEGEHLCKTMRGAKKKGKMITSHMTGVFKDDPAAKEEFMQFVNSSRNV